MGGGSIFDIFFGGGGPFGGMGGEEEDQIPKGDTVTVDLHVTLEDLYNGREIAATRDKAVFVPAPGKRRCKCKQKLMTRQLGPGMIQQFTQQVGGGRMMGWRSGGVKGADTPRASRSPVKRRSTPRRQRP
jgi:DnaJ family protein B protein 11